MKILVADDDPVSRRMMQGMLQRSGYDVVAVADGIAASQELSRADGPRLALIDWMMPGMDGPAVCQAARRQHDRSYTYILLLTSKQSKEDIVAGLEAGADDYLTKPCHPAELKARLLTGMRILKLEDNLVEAREAMRTRATRDSLTQLWNRASILTYLQNSMDQILVEGHSVAILLCDIDHFKQINDLHGHPTGDEVLEQVANRLQDSVRSGDFVGRYGGEEFLIVLSDCRTEELMKQAERVRASVTSEPFATQSGALKVSLSIGAVSVPPLNCPVPLKSIVKHADEALYQAKAGGRNRVCLAESCAVAG